MGRNDDSFAPEKKSQRNGDEQNQTRKQQRQIRQRQTEYKTEKNDGDKCRKTQDTGKNGKSAVPDLRIDLATVRIFDNFERIGNLVQIVFGKRDFSFSDQIGEGFLNILRFDFDDSFRRIENRWHFQLSGQFFPFSG